MNNHLLLAKILRDRRIELGISINSLAVRVGISHTEVSRIESGERQNYNLITLIRMCQVLKLNFVRLLIVTEYLPTSYDADSRYDSPSPKVFPTKEIHSTSLSCESCPFFCEVCNHCMLGGQESVR